MFAAYARNVYAPTKFVDVSIVILQATFATAGTVITRDADKSSPETTIVRDGAGQFTVTFPKCLGAHVVGLSRMLAEAGAGQFIDAETLVSTTGTLTFETSSTKGTAADPADGERIFVTLICFNQ